MEIHFNNTDLADLYEGKKVNNKFFSSSPQLVSQFVKVVEKLRSVPKIEDMYKINSLNYKALTGKRKGSSSVRINGQYRLIFEIIKEDKEPFNVKLLSIEEISNHYTM